VLEYDLTQADLAAFAAWQAKTSGEEEERSGRMRLAAAWIVGTAAYLVAFAISTFPLLLGSQLALAGVAEVVDIAVGAAAGWWEWRRGRVGERLLTRRYRTRARLALAKTGAARRLELGANGLSVASGERQAQVPWAQVTGVVDTADHLFILTGPNAAHVVPRRVDPEAVAKLAEGIRARVVG
jgi:hypothetical protein